MRLGPTDRAGLGDVTGGVIAADAYRASADALGAEKLAYLTDVRPKVSSIVTAQGRAPQAHILDGRMLHVVLLEVFTDEGVDTMVIAPEDGR